MDITSCTKENVHVTFNPLISTIIFFSSACTIHKHVDHYLRPMAMERDSKIPREKYFIFNVTLPPLATTSHRCYSKCYITFLHTNKYLTLSNNIVFDVFPVYYRHMFRVQLCITERPWRTRNYRRISTVYCRLSYITTSTWGQRTWTKSENERYTSIFRPGVWTTTLIRMRLT